MWTYIHPWLLIMNRFSYRRYYRRRMRLDTFIVLAPPILTFIGILWFFSEEWVPKRVATVIASFVDSILALLTSAA